jgi:RNA-directed DNA polymerase
MDHLEALQAATTRRDVAELLGFNASALAYILFKKGTTNYTTFEIPKRGGGKRQICAPADQLKLLQRRLAKILEQCAHSIREANNRNDSIAHGFKKGRSIITNARIHRNRRFVFNVDLQDFFGQIHFGRVRGFFIKDTDFSLKPDVATVLAQIACFENRLPQGSPCSPIISNLVAHVLDIHLVRLAAKYGCSYTRYADDLTFSTNKKEFPSQIARKDAAKSHAWVPGKRLVEAISKSGFAINPTKVHMQYRDSRQEVTGLVVNKKVNVRSEYRHTVRAMVHHLFRDGKFTLRQPITDSKGTTTILPTEGKPGQLHGMLGFIDALDLHNEVIERNLESAKEIHGHFKKEEMYRHFLMFSQLYAAAAPLIICEGKTDPIYLVHAIRSLASKYPYLAMKDKAGAITIRARIYKYRGTSTSRLLGITGGTSKLTSLMHAYREDIDRFTAPGKTHPVLFLVDNDEAGGKVYKQASGIAKIKLDPNDPFARVFANLYLVATPLPTGASQSCIEDLFDKATRSIPVGGKKFDPEADDDSGTHYGKTVFAHKVIAAQPDKIDFSGFVPLLDRIVSVIASHAAKFPAAPL